MDLQVKLANDGYAQESNVPLSASWPRWANWRNTAYALTYEPAVFIYHKPSFAGTKPPSTRAELIQYLEANADAGPRPDRHL
jgi:iron(III) transport system substrate-binding protein